MSSSHDKATLDYALEAMDKLATDLNLRYSKTKRSKAEIIYGGGGGGGGAGDNVATQWLEDHGDRLTEVLNGWISPLLLVTHKNTIIIHTPTIHVINRTIMCNTGRNIFMYGDSDSTVLLRYRYNLRKYKFLKVLAIKSILSTVFKKTLLLHVFTHVEHDVKSNVTHGHLSTLTPFVPAAI